MHHTAVPVDGDAHQMQQWMAGRLNIGPQHFPGVAARQKDVRANDLRRIGRADPDECRRPGPEGQHEAQRQPAEGCGNLPQPAGGTRPATSA